MGRAQIRQRRNFDRKTSPRKAYCIDESVMVFIDTAPKGGNHKLTCKWRGPFKVAAKSKDGRIYYLQNGHKANVTRLKKYQPRVGEMYLNKRNERICWSRWNKPLTVAPNRKANKPNGFSVRAGRKTPALTGQ